MIDEAALVTLVSTSGLFDERWYCDRYHDVRTFDDGALVHYVRYGRFELRHPTAWFDPSTYHQGHQQVPIEDCFEHFLTTRLQEPEAVGNVADSRSTGVSIVIAVHDAFESVEHCLSSVLTNTDWTMDNDIICIDDASTDPRILELLEEATSGRGRVVRNPQNLGYTRTVNRGMAEAGQRDVVLLNSDTVVARHWLRNLRAAGHHRSNIGTVTAVSNNAGAFSVPAPGGNDLPDGCTVDQAARAVADANLGRYAETPTGNGFCLYVRRRLIDAIGAFDAEGFPRGYGEENDFCLRAIDAGYVNLIDTGTYVFHEGSMSFGDEKAALVRAGVDLVRHRYPEYRQAVEELAASPVLAAARRRAAVALADADDALALPRVAFVGRPAPQAAGAHVDFPTVQLHGVVDEFALQSDGGAVSLTTCAAMPVDRSAPLQLESPVTTGLHRSMSYDDLIRGLLFRHSIDLLVVASLRHHSLGLFDVANSLGIPVVMSLSDPYLLSPWSATDATTEDRDMTELVDRWRTRIGLQLGRVSRFVAEKDHDKSLAQAALPGLMDRASDVRVLNPSRSSWWDEVRDLVH